MYNSASVCIPVYRPDKKLSILLWNLIDRGLINEIVIIETLDFSPDPELQIMLDTMRDNTEVQIKHDYIQKPMFNHSKVRNSLVSIASNETLIFCTQDIEIDELFDLKLILNDFKNYDALSLAHSSHLQSFSYIFKNMFDVICETEISSQSEVVWWSNNFAIYKKSLLIELPFPNIDFAEDLYWAKLAARNGFKLKVSNVQLIAHLNNDTLASSFERGRLEAVGHLAGHRLLGIPTQRQKLLKSWLKHEIGMAYKSIWKMKILQFKSEIIAHRNHSIQYYSFLREWNSLLGVASSSQIRNISQKVRWLLKHPIRGFPVLILFLKRRFLDTPRFIPDQFSEYFSNVYGLNQTNNRNIADGKSKMVWVCPPIDFGGGGATTISRFIIYLSGLGIPISIAVLSERDFDLQRQQMLWYDHLKIPRKVEVFRFSAKSNPGNFYIGTAWQTWSAVIRIAPRENRVVFLQDDERLFEPFGDSAIFIEDALDRFDFCIAAGPWLAEIASRHNIRFVTHFRFGVDKIYSFRDQDSFRDKARKNQVVVFFQPGKARRLPQLTLAFCKEISKEFPDLDIVTFGAVGGISGVQKIKNLGVLPPQDLADLYSLSSIGICFSATNASLVPQEMASCGLQVISNDGLYSEWLTTNGRINFVKPNLEALMEAFRVLHCRFLPEFSSTEAVWTSWEHEIQSCFNKIVGDNLESGLAQWLKSINRE